MEESKVHVDLLLKYDREVYLGDQQLVERLKQITNASELEEFLKERYESRRAQRLISPDDTDYGSGYFEDELHAETYGAPLGRAAEQSPGGVRFESGSVAISATTPGLALDSAACTMLARAAEGEQLRTREVSYLLENCIRLKLPVSVDPPTEPPVGSLFIMSKQRTPHYKRDGYAFNKESHSELKVDGQPFIKVYYGSLSDGTLSRHCYWRLESPDLVLTHYRHPLPAKPRLDGQHLQEIDGRFSLLPGANIGVKSREKDGAFIHAADEGRTRRVHAAALAGLDTKAKNKSALSTAMKHVGRSEAEIVRDVLQVGEMGSVAGYPALIWLCKEGHEEAVQALLAKGADVNVKDALGCTAIIFAAGKGHTMIVLALLAAGADVGAQDKDGVTALIRAVDNGHTEIVKALLAAGAVVDGKKENGGTALTCAANKGHAEIVQVLLAAGADLAVKNAYGRTALILAAFKGRTEVVRAMLAAGADLAVKDAYGRTALILAADKGHAATVRELLKAGANVDEQDKDGETALVAAASKGHLEAVLVLLGAGPDVEVRNKDGETAFIVAAARGQTKVIQALLAAGADMDARNKMGKTALDAATSGGHNRTAQVLKAAYATNTLRQNPAIREHRGNEAARRRELLAGREARKALPAVGEVQPPVNRAAGVGSEVKNTEGHAIAFRSAAAAGDVDQVQELLAQGGHGLVDDADEDGATALLHAADKGHTEIVQALLAAGANVDIADRNGDTALILAAARGHEAIVQDLLTVGADVGVQDKDGNTALMAASRWGHTETVQALLAAGADFGVQNKAGDTALIRAADHGHTETVLALLLAAADVGVRNNDGETALIAASEGGYTQIVQYLLCAGADVAVQNKDGKTAMDVATARGRKGAVETLQAACAAHTLRQPQGKAAARWPK